MFNTKSFKMAICDNEAYYRDFLREKITAFMENHRLDFTIDLFTDGKSLTALESEITAYDIIFLDINMEELDGMQTAYKIRAVSPDVAIVFVTAFQSYALEGYKVGAVRYLLKNSEDFTVLLTECLEAVLAKMNVRLVRVEYSFIGGAKELNAESIRYVESKLHTLTFHVADKERADYRLYGKLDEIEKDLKPHGFVRIHQSYLINTRYLTEVKNYAAVLDNGKVLSVAKPKFKTVREKFVESKGEL